MGAGLHKWRTVFRLLSVWPAWGSGSGGHGRRPGWGDPCGSRLVWIAQVGAQPAEEGTEAPGVWEAVTRAAPTEVGTGPGCRAPGGTALSAEQVEKAALLGAGIYLTMGR